MVIGFKIKYWDERYNNVLTFLRSANIRGLPLLHMTDVPLKSNSILAMSTSISSFSFSAITTTIPPPKLLLAMANWFSSDPWEYNSLLVKGKPESQHTNDSRFINYHFMVIITNNNFTYLIWLNSKIKCTSNGVRWWLRENVLYFHLLH